MILGGPIELSSDQQARFVGMLAGALLIGLLAALFTFRALSGRWSVAVLATGVTLLVALGLRRGAALDGGGALFGGFATGAAVAVGARLALGHPGPRSGPGWQDPSELAP